MANENKFKHMEMIQDVINRLANNSFMIKGWCITIVAAIFVLGEKDGTKNEFLFIALIPIVSFWILDSFYLRGERLYRALYRKVITIKDDNTVDFSMNTEPFEKEIKYCHVFISKTILGFYLPFVIVIIILMFALGCVNWTCKNHSQNKEAQSTCAPFKTVTGCCKCYQHSQ